MAKERSLQDEIRRRQQGGFVGRQGQVVQFEDNLRLPVDDGNRRFLFNVYGDAGVGKTYLTKRLRQIAVGSGSITAYLDETAADPVSIMRAVADAFAVEGMQLDQFEKRAAAYRRRRREIEADSEAPDGVAAFLTKTAVTIGLAAARDIPVAGSLLAPVDSAAVAEQANQARAYLTKKFGDKEEAQLLLSPEDELTPLFVADLHRIYGGRTVALFFDTYERTGQALDGWLRSLYAGRYGDLPATLVTTISGQLPLDANLWADYLPVMGDLPVEPFTETEARLFLSGKGITEEATVRVILTLSGRLPLWLATLAEARPGSAADVGDPAGDVVERFLRWESDPVRRGIALAAAFPRILNQDVLAAAAPDGTALFGWLRGLPFVSHRGNYWEYHEVVRGAMLRLQFAEAPARWRAQHAALAQAYEQWADDTIGQTNVTWTNDAWVDCLREATYHLLCADPVGNLPRALETAVKAAEHSSARLRQWAQLIIDASRDTGDEVLSQYGLRLQSLIKGSESELARYFTEPGANAPERTQPLDTSQPWAASSSEAAPQGTAPGRKGSRPRAPGSRATVPGPVQSQIAMLGAPASGKTTFLSALSIALARRSLGWRLRGVDEPSVEALIEATELLASGHQFPASTASIETYNLALETTIRVARRGPFRRHREENVSIGLKLVDVAGQATHFSAVGSSEREALLDTLAGSSGIILLFDPVREFEQGDTFDFIFGVLAQLMQRASFETSASTARLPQYVAVCITKFDELRVFEVARSLGLLSESSEGGLSFPCVDDEDARPFFKRLNNLSATGNGEMITRMLEDYLRPDHVRYFVTSAIGFYQEPRSDRFDKDDLLNLIVAPGDPRAFRIRGPIRPINVVEPLLWVCSAILNKPVT